MYVSFSSFTPSKENPERKKKEKKKKAKIQLNVGFVKNIKEMSSNNSLRETLGNSRETVNTYLFWREFSFGVSLKYLGNRINFIFIAFTLSLVTT